MLYLSKLGYLLHLSDNKIPYLLFNELQSRSLKKDKRVNKTEETDKVTGDTNTVNSKGEGGNVSGVTAGQENLEPVSSNITCKGDNMIVANQQEVEFTKNQTVTVKGITDKNEDDKVSPYL